MSTVTMSTVTMSTVTMSSKFIFFAVLTLFSTTSLACSCAYPRVDDAFNNSDLVFKGKVIELEPPTSSTFNRVTFDVYNVYKGSEKSSEAIFTNRSSAACGYPFKQGEEYLVFAFLGSRDQEEKGFSLENKLMVTMCSLTTPLNSSYPNIEKRSQEIMEFLNVANPDS